MCGGEGEREILISNGMIIRVLLCNFFLLVNLIFPNPKTISEISFFPQEYIFVYILFGSFSPDMVPNPALKKYCCLP